MHGRAIRESTPHYRLEFSPPISETPETTNQLSEVQMPANDPVIRRMTSRLGVAMRKGDPDAIAEARRDMATAQMEVAIRKAIASAPPLTDAQRDHLRSLLMSGGAR